MDNTLHYLGVDWGEKRIGLATGDSSTKLALPFKTVSSLSQLLKVIEEDEIDIVVIGAPHKMSGEEASSSPWLQFVAMLKELANIEIILQDERLSSRAAENLFGTKRDKVAQDESAAAIILQSYFDKQE